MQNFLEGLVDYLKDWRNLLGHALLGVAILAFAALMPVPTWARILLFFALVGLNLLRERFKHRSSESEPDRSGES